MRSLAFIFIFLPVLIKSQVYTAGQLLATYVDVSPDSTLYGYENYSLDVNGDNVNDLKIEATYMPFAGATVDFIKLTPLNVNTYTLFKRLDSVYVSNWPSPGYSWGWFTKIAKPLFVGDTINKTGAIWTNTVSYLNDKSMDKGFVKNVLDWVNPADQYIGVKYKTTTDTVFGWIRVQVPVYNKCTILDYSFNYSGVGIKEYDAFGVRIFPNPVSEILLLSDQQNRLRNSEVVISNSLGQTVIKTEFTNEIDVSKLPPGIYSLRMREKFAKFIKE